MNNKFKRTCSAVLVSALLIGAPGLPAWEAAAQVVRGSAAPVSAAASRAWGAVVADLATTLQTRPELSAQTPGLGSVLGNLRLELALQPRSQAALAFVSRLPAGVEPKSFSEMPPAGQARLLDAAVAAVTAELQPRAETLVAKAAQGDLTAEDRSELATLAKSWFYLPSDRGQALRNAAAQARAGASLGLAQRIARRFMGDKKENPAAIVDAELGGILAGAAKIVDAEQGNATPGTLVPNRLAPYVAKALDEAEVRAVERGAVPGLVARTVIEGHDTLFGKAADRKFFKALRQRGEWTEFVAAMSLHAADRFAQSGQAAVQVLAKTAEADDLRLAIPSWHPLFGRYASIAEWLTEAHGKPDDSKELTGWPLMTAFGIPVRAQKSLVLALVLGSYQFLSIFAKASPHYGLAVHVAQGAATIALLYASVLAHEFGHAFAARAFGIRTRKIILNWLGGGADIVRGFRQALPEFVIALAGPVVSALAGLALLAAAHIVPVPLLLPILVISGKLNLVLAVFNMLPVFPMDGGRVLRAILTRPFGSYRATKAAGAVGMALSGLMVLKGVAISPTNLSSALQLIAIGVFFLVASKMMSVHPGTTTVDEKRAQKS